MKCQTADSAKSLIRERNEGEKWMISLFSGCYIEKELTITQEVHRSHTHAHNECDIYMVMFIIRTDWVGASHWATAREGGREQSRKNKVSENYHQKAINH